MGTGVNDKRIRRKYRRFCTKCGLLSCQDICLYCGGVTVPYTGQTRSETPIDKPVVDIKEVKDFIEYEKAILVFGNIVIALIYIVILTNLIGRSSMDYMVGLANKTEAESPAIYLIILVALLVFQTLFNIIYLSIRFIKLNDIKKNGKVIEGTVHGYLNDQSKDYNNNNFQILEIDVNTPEMQGLVLSKVRSAIRSYKEGEKVQIKVYKDKYLLVDKKIQNYYAEPDYHIGGYVDDASNESLRPMACKSLHVDKKQIKKNWTILFVCMLILIAIAGFDGKSFSFKISNIQTFACVVIMIIMIIVVLLYTLSRNNKINNIKRNGTYVNGVVVGYTDSNEHINNVALTAVKIRIETPDGPRCIAYDLHSDNKPYEINQPVKLITYQDYYLIID